MKLKDFKEESYYFTGKLSEINRQLAFAGIAIIWIFKNTTEGTFKLPYELLIPATLLVASLAADLLQYIYQALAWSIFHRYHEKKKKEDEDFLAPISMNYASWGLFILKVFFTVTAYILILIFLQNHIK